MEARTGQTKHMAVSLRLVEMFLDSSRADEARDWFVQRNGYRPTVEEIREFIASMKSQGYDVLPPCDDTDETGRCRGHNTEHPAANG